MDIATIKAQTRQTNGTGVARKARAKGLLPGSLYGGGAEPVSMALDSHDFEMLIHHSRGGEHAVLKMEFADAPQLNTAVLVKAVQHHPLRGQMIHVDFLRIRLDERIETVVAVELTGQAPGVVEGGVLDHPLRDLEIECLALEVPEQILVDVSGLQIGDSIHVRDLVVPQGVTVLTDPDRPVAAVLAPRVEAAAEGAEGAEGEGSAQPEVIAKGKEED